MPSDTTIVAAAFTRATVSMVPLARSQRTTISESGCGPCGPLGAPPGRSCM
jgi:hypothetical protein